MTQIHIFLILILYLYSKVRVLGFVVSNLCLLFAFFMGIHFFCYAHGGERMASHDVVRDIFVIM
jgi:hypothetical protein